MIPSMRPVALFKIRFQNAIIPYPEVHQTQREHPLKSEPSVLTGDERATAIAQILDAYPHAAFRCLADYYLMQSKGDALPVRATFDMMAIYKIAERLVLIDLEGEVDGFHRFKWRYAGTGLRRLVGVEMTGRYLDDVAEPDNARMAATIYREMIETRAPHVWRHNVRVQEEDRRFLDYDRFLLPLADDQGACRHLIGVYAFDDSKPDDGEEGEDGSNQ